MKTEIEKRVIDLLSQVSELAGPMYFEIPEIKTNLRGRCAGQCIMRGVHCTLRFNAKILKENYDEYMKDTVPHEVAHYVVALLYGKVAPHGREWKGVMNLFGIKNPQRCHTFNIKDTYPWIYKCQCREHFVGNKLHALIRKGARIYRCKNCNAKVIFVGKRVDKSE